MPVDTKPEKSCLPNCHWCNFTLEVLRGIKHMDVVEVP